MNEEFKNDEFLLDDPEEGVDMPAEDEADEEEAAEPTPETE
jgi:hypothetical protein